MRQETQEEYIMNMYQYHQFFLFITFLIPFFTYATSTPGNETTYNSSKRIIKQI